MILARRWVSCEQGGHTRLRIYPRPDAQLLRAYAHEPPAAGRSAHAHDAGDVLCARGRDDVIRRRVGGRGDARDGVHSHENGRGHGRAACGGRNARGSAHDEHVRAHGDACARVSRS